MIGKPISINLVLRRKSNTHYFRLILLKIIYFYATTRKSATIFFIYGLPFMLGSLLLRNFVLVIVFMAHFIMFDNTETEFRNCIGRKFEYYVERVT